MEWALHGANIFILCSFLVRDILILRLLSIAAGILFCTYFYAHGMMEPIAWNTLFSIVNVVQIGRMWLSRRKVPLSSEERFLHERFFPSLQPLEIRALFQLAELKDVPPEEEITCNGLGVLVKGSVSFKEGELHSGCFLGVRSFLERKEGIFWGKALKPISLISWPIQDVRHWAEKNPERNNLLLRALSNDLIKRLRPEE